uniref:Putative variable membrane protein 1 n=3 Tax=Candidatus Phytoplasma solani TaxID=69896 RepID=B0JE57_9MOLU|nr:putative variable membrane protein 1 [Candidatus Phytoplasma solani]
MCKKLIAFLVFSFIIINFSIFSNNVTGKQTENNPNSSTSEVRSSDDSTILNNRKTHIKNFLKPDSTRITLTAEEVLNVHQQSVLDKILIPNQTRLSLNDVVLTFASTKHLVAAASTTAPNLEGKVTYEHTTSTIAQLNSLLKSTNTAIILTSEESRNPNHRSVLNKVLNPGQNLSPEMVNISFNSSTSELKIAVAKSCWTITGSEVVFNQISVTQDLSNFTKTPTDQAITVTQAESTNPTQVTVNKFLQTAGSLTVGTDVTITFNANERKATLAVVANSTRAQGDNVVFTNVTVTVEKQDLSNFTKPTTETITVTQAEVTSRDQNALNKFLKQAGSLTVNTDATIEFDTTNKKATLTAAQNSTKAQGSVVFTNVTVEKPALSQKLTEKELGQINARTQAAVKAAMLSKNTNLQNVDQNRFTITLDTDASKSNAKVTHPDFAGEVEVSFSVQLKLESILTSTQRDLGKLPERSVDAVRKALLTKKIISSLTPEQQQHLKIELIENKNEADISSSDFSGTIRITFSVQSYTGLIFFVVTVLSLIIIMFVITIKRIKEVK